MSLETFLDHRDDRLIRARDLERRDAKMRSWVMDGVSPEARLLRFDGWVRGELEARIDWTWARELKPRRIEQCRIHLENLAVSFERRGWLLDGRRFAAHITDALDDVAKAQREGRVRDFWPFFEQVVTRYAGLNAEEIQDEAMALGVHVGQMFARIGAKAPQAPSITELLAQRRAETLREKVAAQRRLEARHAADKAQLPLFGGVTARPVHRS